MQPATTVKTPINFIYSPQMHLLYCDQRDTLEKWQASNVRVPYWRLYWNDRKGACLTSATGRYPLKPSNFVLVAPHTTLSSNLEHPVSHFHAHFSVGLPFALVQSYVHCFPAKAWLLAIMRRYYPAYNTPLTDLPDRTAAVMTLCWHALMTLPAKLFADLYAEPRLTNLLHWWEEQEWQNIPNSDLAKRIGMETTAFCRLFSKVLGQPPHTYGLNKRLNHASIMLRFSNSSIEAIAELNGFCDRYHFTRMFKQRYKITPSAFRRIFSPKNT